MNELRQGIKGGMFMGVVGMAFWRVLIMVHPVAHPWIWHNKNPRNGLEHLMGGFGVSLGCVVIVGLLLVFGIPALINLGKCYEGKAE